VAGPPPTTTAAPELFNPDADGLVGEVKIWPAHALPSAKWLFCDGSAVSRETYSLLYSRIGEEHGTGDGSTTFNLPNYEGMFLVGYKSSDADFDNIGETGGSKASNMPAHTHGVGTLAISPNPHDHPPATGQFIDGTPGNYQAGGTVNAGNHAANATGTTSLSLTGSTDSQGSGSATNGNLPPYTVTRFIIKAL
jgi:microcystin-dependent protein